LRFDGCSKGNPGPSGAGAVIYQNNNEIWGKSAFVGLKSTNNEAEYMGLIIGLQEASNMKIKHLSMITYMTNIILEYMINYGI
jgi:ribonuclease HI